MPSNYFLRMLLNKMDYLEGKDKESQQYFQIMMQLLGLYFKEENLKGELLDINKILQDNIDKLFNYKSKEIKNTLSEDFNLIGLLDVTREII